MKRLVMTAATLLLAGCSAQQLKPGADKIRVFQTEPKGCKYLGEATGNQGNFLSGGWTSNENLETGARNTLKNKAMEMGGNAVAILTNRAGNTGSFGQYGGGMSQTNVTLAGTVYNCPENVLNQ